MNKNLPTIFSLGFVVLLILFAVFFNNKSQTTNTNVKSLKNQATEAINQKVPDAEFSDLSGKKVKLSDYKGKKVMFWVFATWCPSCIAGAQELEKNNNKLQNLNIIATKTFGNAGYPGPSVLEFAQRYSPSLLKEKNWIWGDLKQEPTKIYNPKNYPDIYFLIDEKGILRNVSGAPAATINKIINFANE